MSDVSPVADGSLTPEERGLRFAVGVIGVLSAGFLLTYVVTAVTYDSVYPFVANSLAKDVLFLALAILGVGDIRRFAYASLLLVLGHLLLVVGLSLVFFFGGGVSKIDGTLDPHSLPFGIGPGTLFWIWLGADIAIVIVLAFLYERAQRARFQLRYLSSFEFSTLRALAEVLTPDSEANVSTLQVARHVDTYLAGFRAQGKGKVRAALLGLTVYPLLTAHPPFSMMSEAGRLRFVQRRMLSDVWGRRLPTPLRTLVQAMIRAAQQLAFIGYYEQPVAAMECGYLKFSQRDDYEELLKCVDWGRRRVTCMEPEDVHSDVITTDIAIVGSGAAGSILAYELARRDREVLILERGLHVDPSDFTEIESEQLSTLYADGALTLSRDFRFQILQGMCVGGSTVVNNGVCFDIPPRALAIWQDPDGLDAGLDPDELRHSFKAVRKLVRVRPLVAGDRLSPGWSKFNDGVRELGLTDPPYQHGFFECNTAGDCLGCGYCNIGCRFGKKLSMLETVLPMAQAEFGEAVRILARCQVNRVETAGGRALALECQLGDRKVKVRANRIVLSAGAVASSMLLKRSNVGGNQVGKHLGFNAGSPLTAEFRGEPLHAERGLQMTNYVLGPDGQDFALETWFNPLASQALFMPGWFEQHRANMLQYPHMMSVGAVVGTRRNATVSRQLIGRGVKLDYEPTPDDFQRIVEALKLAGRILLKAGAERVMPPSFRYMEARCESQLDRFDELRDSSDLSINSSHPQGGNCLSRDPRKGVVDENFRVDGVENLFVCDASVFPAPITVNPQLTVMALAHYAARRVAASPNMPTK